MQTSASFGLQTPKMQQIAPKKRGPPTKKRVETSPKPIRSARFSWEMIGFLMVLSSQLRSTMIGSQPFEMVFPWFPVPASPDFPAFPTPNSPLWPQKVAHWHPQRQSVGWSKFLVHLSLYSTPYKNDGSEWFLGVFALQASGPLGCSALPLHCIPTEQGTGGSFFV